ncbi:hypothetical protein, partial [Dolosigranulum pigrum]|uniref:hypothetical protein n=1 Tax=Dolosigranulum pigrum TaxID=29394 RepID=UPI000DBF6807
RGKKQVIETSEIIEDGLIIGTKITVKEIDASGKETIVSEHEALDGSDGQDGKDGRDGQDGKTPTVRTEPIKDEEGNSIGSRTIIDDGRGKK